MSGTKHIIQNEMLKHTGAYTYLQFCIVLKFM